MENKIVSETFRNNHPFEVLMDSGKCTKSQLQSWICNRYYFQKTMVSKDAIILSKCPDREFRQMWIKCNRYCFQKNDGCKGCYNSGQMPQP